jgi:glycosyltransferase involved in cell wall biosynthesis
MTSTEQPNNKAAELDRISAVVEDMVMREKPASILEISDCGLRFGALFAGCLERIGAAGCRIDRINLSPGDIPQGLYASVLPAAALNGPDALGVYDFIFISGLPERIKLEDAHKLIATLQEHVTKQILVVTPEYLPGRTPPRREYHPVAFTGLDFSYWMLKAPEGNWQFYSFFKKQHYEPMPLDDIAEKEPDAARKMRIAFILPHRGVTGGLIALLQQMKRLTQRGHTVKAYLRSNYGNRAIPDWSELRDEDVAEQVVVPEGASFLAYIKDVDVIFVGWMDSIPELIGASVPVVLWEQGYEYLYGDYGDLKDSSFWFRNHMAELYRLPFHILTVSPILGEIILAKYNRKSSVLTPCVDTGFFFPWQKNDETPPVLLVGHPKLDFKGFDFAFKVLNNAWERGARFTVWWAYQVEPESRPETPFPVNYYYMLTRDSLALLYRFAYVFMSCSLYESCPLPPLEAMASGTPVLATDSGGIRTYAKPGEKLLLCAQGDIECMTKQLISLLEDPERRQRLGAAGRETALDFSADRVTDKIERTLAAIAFAEIQTG